MKPKLLKRLKVLIFSSSITLLFLSFSLDQEYLLIQYIQDRVVKVLKSPDVFLGDDDDNIPRAYYEGDGLPYPCTIIDRCHIDDQGMI